MIERERGRVVPSRPVEQRRTTLVTGAGGLVGRALVAALLAASEDVVAQDIHLDDLTKAPGLRLVEGDLTDPGVRATALNGIDRVVHLAAALGQRSETDWAFSMRANIEVPIALLGDIVSRGPGVRFVFASSVAVFGSDLPPEGVDDRTSTAPTFLYGAQKAMIEVLVSTLSSQGKIDGLSLRLPGVLPRRRTPAALDAGFMSNVFHVLIAGECFQSPVSAGASMWVQSLSQIVQNFRHALDMDTALLPPSRIVTLPALRVTMGQLAETIRAACQDAGSVAYAPDMQLELAFGRQPPLGTPVADNAGFKHERSVAELVGRVLDAIG